MLGSIAHNIVPQSTVAQLFFQINLAILIFANPFCLSPTIATKFPNIIIILRILDDNQYFSQ